MNDITHNKEDAFLEPFIASARQSADEAHIAEAARRLRERLPAREEARAGGWLPRFATAAVLITGLALSLQLTLPGSANNAFADVQEWFSSYRTLEVSTEITSGDQVMVDVHVQATVDGNVHIEQAGIVYILNAADSTFSTLMPGNRYFQQPVSASPGTGDSLEWVEKLAAFRGDAEKLDQTRRIDGREAIGHRLVIDDIDLVLWSDAVDNAPLLLEGDLPGGLQLKTRFAFNVAFEPLLFDVPEGFVIIESE